VRTIMTSLAAIGVVGLTLSAGVATAFANTEPPAQTAGQAVAAGSPVPRGAIQHVIVVDLENEEFDDSFGPDSVARYLNDTLVPQGQLLSNYYATGHASTDNYLAQVSGQAPNHVSSNDCIVDFKTFRGAFLDVMPGTPSADQLRYPGQVDGQGCVYPESVRTIGSQIDELPGAAPSSGALTWRQYAEDMGNDPARDHGTPDPLGGTDCAHPPIGGDDVTNTATATDQYADRHVPFLFFHSVIDDPAYCARHVVPLGTVQVRPGQQDMFAGHLAEDLAQERTTPTFAMITPNLCNDGHDATCKGTNVEGGHTGGLVAADLWLRHWMPLILFSPAYRDGHTLVVVTFDESNPFTDATACCDEQPGPGKDNPGYASILSLFGLPAPTAPGQYPGGGRIGAVLLNPKWIQAGSINPTPYNHYSALRSYEDILGITTGGADGAGHLGFAAQAGLRSFGADVFG